MLAEYYNPCEDALQTLDAESAASVMERLQPQTRAEGSTISGNISLVDDIAGKNAPVAHVQLILSCTEASGVVRSETVYTDGSGNYSSKTAFPTDMTAALTVNWKIIDPGFYDSSYYIGSTAGSMAASTYKIRSSTLNILFDCLTFPEQHRYASAAQGLRMAMIHGLDDNGYGRSSLSVVCTNTTQEQGDEMGQFVPERPGLTPANLKIYCRNQPSQEIVAATCLALGDMSFTLKKQSTVSTDMIRDSWRVFTRSYFLDKAYSNIGALVNSIRQRPVWQVTPRINSTCKVGRHLSGVPEPRFSSMRSIPSTNIYITSPIGAAFFRWIGSLSTTFP